MGQHEGPALRDLSPGHARPAGPSPEPRWPARVLSGVSYASICARGASASCGQRSQSQTRSRTAATQQAGDAAGIPPPPFHAQRVATVLARDGPSRRTGSTQAPAGRSLRRPTAGGRSFRPSRMRGSHADSIRTGSQGIQPPASRTAPGAAWPSSPPVSQKEIAWSSLSPVSPSGPIALPR